VRKCSGCDIDLEYSSYHSWWWANRHNQVCRGCAHTGKILTDETKRKISLVVSGKGNPMYGHHHTKKVKQFISLNNKGNRSKSGQICDADTKMNMRKAAIKRIKIQGTSRSYNPVACDFMDAIKKYKFLHARNSSDEYQFRGYFADGYDKNRNIWFEYDEPHHYRNGLLKKKDFFRMREVIDNLHCRFLRYNEQKKVMIEYFSDENEKPLDITKVSGILMA
jgi:hypothetical protein